MGLSLQGSPTIKQSVAEAALCTDLISRLEDSSCQKGLYSWGFLEEEQLLMAWKHRSVALGHPVLAFARAETGQHSSQH